MSIPPPEDLNWSWFRLPSWSVHFHECCFLWTLAFSNCLCCLWIPEIPKLREYIRRRLLDKKKRTVTKYVTEAFGLLLLTDSFSCIDHMQVCWESSSRLRDQTYIGRRILYHWATGKAQLIPAKEDTSLLPLNTVYLIQVSGEPKVTIFNFPSLPICHK